jgi:antitoxin component of MazEF toxin-antitoxin module
MNAIVDSKAFKAGNSVAVRLPKSFGIAEGTELQLEQTVRGILITEKADPAEVKRRWHALLDEMDAMPKPDYIEKREPIIFRDD